MCDGKNFAFLHLATLLSGMRQASPSHHPLLLLRPLFGLWPQGGDVWHHGAPGNYRGMSHTERVAACTLKGHFSSVQETRKCLALCCCPEQISWDNLSSLNQMLNPNLLLKSPFLVIVLRRALMFPAHVPVIYRYLQEDGLWPVCPLSHLSVSYLVCLMHRTCFSLPRPPLVCVGVLSFQKMIEKLWFHVWGCIFVSCFFVFFGNLKWMWDLC